MSSPGPDATDEELAPPEVLPIVALLCASILKIGCASYGPVSSTAQDADQLLAWLRRASYGDG